MKKLLLLLLLPLCSTAQQVTTFAGLAGLGYEDGPIATAKFDGPNAACFDTDGNMYIADKSNNKIRKVSADGIVTTLAGSTEGFADGTGSAAMFYYPTGICINSNGDLFIVESFNHRVRKITQTGVVTTIAGSTAGNTDGIGSLAKFNFPEDICIDSNDNLYVVDSANNLIRKITPLGMVSTIAGSSMGYEDGTGTVAKFWFPSGICIDSTNNLYITDQNNRRIRKITPNNIVTTYAGSTWGYTDGNVNIAQFKNPTGLCVDNNGNLYITDSTNQNIRKIDVDGNVTTYAGGSTSGNIDGFGTLARFTTPLGVCIDNSLNLFVTQNDGKIKKIASPLSSPDYNYSKFVIYPNPCKDRFKIESVELFDSVKIYDIIGNLVYNSKPINNEIIFNKLLNKGIYFVHIVSNNNDIFTTKLIIE